MNPRKGYRENVAEQERRMIELEHKLEVATRQRDELAEALRETIGSLAVTLMVVKEFHGEDDPDKRYDYAEAHPAIKKARKALATKEGVV